MGDSVASGPVIASLSSDERKRMQDTQQTQVNSYLSALQLKRLEDVSVRPGSDGFHGAVVLVDVVGFTAMTRHYSEQGARGAEELSDVLNHVFGAIIDIIAAHGGDIQTFAGDAVLAVWPARPDHLEEAVTLAVQASQRIHEIPDHPQRALQLRTSVGSGPLRAFDVGGVDDRWMLVTAGSPLAQVALADKQCNAGEIVVSTEAWSHIDQRCRGEMRSGNVIAIREVTQPVQLPKNTARPSPSIDVQPYVLDVVHRRLTMGHGAFLAEFRTLTILFITLTDVDTASDQALDQLHTAAEIMQRELDRAGGSVYQFLSDDKGTTLLGAFGLPGLAHEDDAVRGVTAALAIRKALAKAGQRSAIGVATGKLFCGSYGNDTRRSYAVVGTTINLSARLMQACEGDGLLCDEATFAAVGERGQFDKLAAVTAKGIDEPVQTFRPTGILARTHGRASALVGRLPEREALTGLLEAARAGDGRTLLIEGEAGIGKSELLRHLIREADGLRVLEGAADSIETTTSWLMWRAVLSELLGDEPGPRLLAAVEGDERLTEWAPILNDVVATGLEENDTSSKISGAARMDGIAELITKLLVQATADGPVLLAVEDAHWLDSSSWSALRSVTKVPGLFLALSTRPIPEPHPADYTAMRENATELVLDSLTPEDAEALVCNRLGIESMPAAISQVLREQAEGHPLYTEELAWSLVERGAITLADGQAELAIPSSELATMSFPDSLQGVITSRIDRLPEESQLLLKVASVIGRVFSLDVLSAVNPVTDDSSRLEQEISELERADLTKPERPKPDLAWIFKHALIQDTAYNLLVFKQRHALHKAVADWYEATFASSLSSYYPVLAHHYSLAEVPEKTLEYLDLAGTRALRTGASAEAASFFERALDLDDRVKKADVLRQARWHRSLGLAQYALGRKYEARASMLKTMALAGRPLASGPIGLLFQLMGQYFWQAVYLASPKALEAKSAQDRELAAEAADAAQYVSTTYYFDKENLPFFVAALMCATESARSGMTREAAVGLSYVGVIVGLFQIDKLHGTYFERGLAAANGVGDPWAVARHWQLRAMQQGGLGRWIDQELEDSIEFFRKTGDRHEFEISLTVKALILQYQGRFAESRKVFVEMDASAEGVSLQHMQWAKTQLAALELIMSEGVGETVMPLLDRATEVLELEPEPPSEVMNTGARVEAVARMDGLVAAQPLARKMWQLAKESPPNSHGGFLMYSFCMERTIEIWVRAAELDLDRAQAKKDMKFGFGQFGMFGFLFPFAKPRIAIYEARVLRHDGKTAKAIKSLHKQIDKAQSMDLKTCIGIAKYELALCHPAGSPERERWKNEAVEQFASVGASHYEALARGV